ncbi:hypothetical protein HK101_000415 [Irineochytrium annulatum]|nr:hypothetical protein HK101_000415 [Irineochytrium annulatum]
MAPSNSDINFTAVCTVFGVFSILLVIAIMLWWRNRKGIVQNLNVIQIFVEWASYGLSMTFTFAPFTDFTRCAVYRWSINLAFHLGFTVAIEVLLVLKARALYPDAKSSTIVLTLCYALVAARVAIAMWSNAKSITTLSAGKCYTSYERSSTLISTLFRAGVELFISLLFAWPIMRNISKLKRANRNNEETKSYTYLFYNQLLKDGVIYPIVVFTANAVLTIVLTYETSLSGLTQTIFATSNVITSGAVFLMTTGVQRAADSAQNTVSRSKTQRLKLSSRDNARQGDVISSIPMSTVINEPATSLVVAVHEGSVKPHRWRASMTKAVPTSTCVNCQVDFLSIPPTFRVLTSAMVSNADINFAAVCTVFSIFSILLALAIWQWWKNKKGIVQILNVVQIFVEFVSYGLSITFRYRLFNDFTRCAVYRWTINMAFHLGFVLAIELLLVIKARALYPDAKSSTIVVALCYSLVAARVAISLWSNSISVTTLSAVGTCYTSYDAYSNLVSSLFRAAVELFISLMFVYPILQHITKIKSVDKESKSYTVLFYTQLLKDGVIYPMIVFTANVILNVVLTYQPSLAGLQQMIFCISNVITSGSIFLMTTGVQRAAESAQNRVSGSKLRGSTPSSKQGTVAGLALGSSVNNEPTVDRTCENAGPVCVVVDAAM